MDKISCDAASKLFSGIKLYRYLFVSLIDNIVETIVDSEGDYHTSILVLIT